MVDPVSPGFEPRPLLSGTGAAADMVVSLKRRGVAGVRTPAFVERSCDDTPASPPVGYEVSPGFEPRPSLGDYIR